MPLRPDYVNNRGVNAPKGNVIFPSAIVRTSWPQVYNTNVAQNPIAASSLTAYKVGFAGPVTATNTYKSTISNATGGVLFDGTLPNGVPDYPRNVVITVTHATSIVAVSGVINGFDQFGRNISEAWSVTATGTSKTFTGAKAFARIDNITITAGSDSSTDTITFGNGNVFQLRSLVSAPKAILELVDGAVVTTGTVVAGSHTNAAADYVGTYSPATAPNGAHTYDVWVLSDQPEAT